MPSSVALAVAPDGNTMVLLGHSTQQMTDMYNDDRGLSAGKWKTLVI